MPVRRAISLTTGAAVILCSAAVGFRSYAATTGPAGRPQATIVARPAGPGIDYQALGLEDCLALARKHNPILAGASERIRELQAGYRAAKSEYFPRLALTSFYERANPDRLSPAGALTTVLLFKDAAWAGVSGKQVLYDGRRTYSGVRAAKKGVEAQEQEVLRTADEVAFAVTEAFYRLVEAKENLAVAAEALQQRREFAALSEAFFKAGKVTRLDSFRAASQVAEAEQARVEAEDATLLAKEILARTAGLEESVSVDIIGCLPSRVEPAPDIRSLWQEASQANPEIRRLDLEIERSKNLIKAVRGAYFPEISLQGSIGVRHYDIAGTKGEWLAGVFLEWPLFEGGLTRARVAEASSQSLQLTEQRRAGLDALKSDLVAAWRDQEDAYKGFLTAGLTVRTNEEAYDSAKALYRSGKAVGLDVLQAQVDLTRSRFDSIRYAVAYQISRARIRQIVGSGPSEPGL